MRQWRSLSITPHPPSTPHPGLGCPARRHDKEPHAVEPGFRGPGVLRHVPELAEHDLERVPRLDRMDEAIADLDRVGLLDIAAEQPVEDDEDAAIVAVEIFLVAGMMHAMRRRG